MSHVRKPPQGQFTGPNTIGDILQMKHPTILKASVAPLALGLALVSSPAFAQDSDHGLEQRDDRNPEHRYRRRDHRLDRNRRRPDRRSLSRARASSSRTSNHPVPSPWSLAKNSPTRARRAWKTSSTRFLRSSLVRDRTSPMVQLAPPRSTCAALAPSVPLFSSTVVALSRVTRHFCCGHQRHPRGADQAR